jgi:hypothetical protein
MKKISFTALAFLAVFNSKAQVSPANITGNLENTFQYLNEDTLIEAQQPASKGLLNSYMNVFYTQGNFKAGMRFESYLPRIQGYPSTFDGTGIGMRYIGYSSDFIDVTMGSIYEQFGNGLSLRAYEDRNLGYDNMIDGARVILRPKSGITLKGVYGYQRYAFLGGRIVHSDGLVRGLDGEVHLNELLKGMKDSKLDVTVGASFVSKYQKQGNSLLTLPENVGAYGGRFKMRYGRFVLDGEYIQKEQDPSEDNKYIYNYGHAAVVNLGYSQKGLGILVSGKSVDNMSYRSDRTKQLQNVLINYLPSLNKTHSYNLVASLYPYATQPVGETAFQTEVMYTIKKGSKLGGKYGTSINANFSSAFRPVQDMSGINPLDSTGVTYHSRPFDKSDSIYWRDINVNITRKFSKYFNVILSYYNLTLNNDVATVTKEKGLIRANIGVLEMGYKFKNKQSIRTEFQALFVPNKDSLGNFVPNGTEGSHKIDKGDWATVIVEYTITSHWFVSVMDQYNYGNPYKSHRAHHPYASVGFIKDATRMTVSYGRQRAGLFCVGGVCRPVPASNGLTFSLTHSF